jgi:hypothetical protein
LLHTFRDDERRRITVTASGTVSFLDLATFIEKQLVGDTWTYAVLHDARTAATDLTAQDSSDVIGHMQEIADGRRRGPVAVVATDPGYLTTAQTYADLLNRAGGRMAIFSNIADASDWLDRQIVEADR